jgi:hypothetical protein
MRKLTEPQAQSFYSALVESARRLGTDELAAEIARVVTDLTEARSLIGPDGLAELEDTLALNDKAQEENRTRAKTKRLVIDVLERKLLALEAIAAERRVQVLLG